MADKWSTDRNEDLDDSVAGASDEQIRGVSNDDFEDTPDNLADDDDEEDEEGSTF